MRVIADFLEEHITFILQYYHFETSNEVGSSWPLKIKVARLSETSEAT
jgi:hypothetical protein